MGLFSLFKRRSDRIRKDAGELVPADYQRYPIWEFAIDEEGLPGQNECAVRPILGTSLPRVWDYLVGCQMTAKSDRVFPGAIQVSSFDIVEKKAPQEMQHWLLSPSGDQGHLYLAAEQYQPDAEALVLMQEVYAKFGTSGNELFPITVQPLVQIPGMPRQWQLPGFRRAPHHSNTRSFLL